VDIPYFLVFAPFSFTARLNRTETFTVWFANTTPFAVSQFGKILTFMVYAVRDGSVMFAQITLNCMPIVLLKRYLTEKMKITKKPSQSIKTDVEASLAENRSMSMSLSVTQFTNSTINSTRKK
jgi:hypothetical protein